MSLIHSFRCRRSLLPPLDPCMASQHSRCPLKAPQTSPFPISGSLHLAFLSKAEKDLFPRRFPRLGWRPTPPRVDGLWPHPLHSHEKSSLGPFSAKTQSDPERGCLTPPGSWHARRRAGWSLPLGEPHQGGLRQGLAPGCWLGSPQFRMSRATSGLLVDSTATEPRVPRGTSAPERGHWEVRS